MRRGMARRVAVLASLAAMLALAACGQPLPAPEGAAPVAAAAQRRPEGRLLFVRGGNLWVWSGGQETRLTDDGGISQPRWSPDGSAMVFIRSGDSFGDLWLADAAGGGQRPLTANRARGYPVDSREYAINSFLLSGPSWARLADGGERIVYSTDSDGGGLALKILNGPQGRPQSVFATADLLGHIEGAALSPDGNQIAFAYDTVDREANTRSVQLHVVDLVSGQHRALTSQTSHHEGAYDPAWSPDGKWLAYATRQGGKTNIWAMRPDGTDNHPLTDGGGDRGPAWSPDGDYLAFVRLNGSGYGLFTVELTAPNGGLAAGRAQPIGEYKDVDPASGVSWTR